MINIQLPTANNDLTHVAFSDESNQNQGRFRSISVVTLKVSILEEVSNSLVKTFIEAGISSEFKWQKLTTAKYRFAAKRILDVIFPYLLNQDKSMRIDTIIWDTHDSRHNVNNRDDHKNFAIMYYRPLLDCLAERWPPNSHWGIYPDETTEINWDNFGEILEKSATAWIRVGKSLPSLEKIGRNYYIDEIQQYKSHDCPIIQVADLFAGMGAFSWNHHNEIIEVLNSRNGQMSLFHPPQKTTNSVKERSHVIAYLDSFCKNKQLRVSLRRNGGLFSYNPNMPINFWKYIPQHEMDRAPVQEP